MRVKAAIEKRVLLAAQYIAETGATVRQTARKFGVSKSTVHKDMEMRLPQLSSALAKEVARVFAKNKAERHLRGGEATRNKYKNNNECHPSDNTASFRGFFLFLCVISIYITYFFI